MGNVRLPRFMYRVKDNRVTGLTPIGWRIAWLLTRINREWCPTVHIENSDWPVV
jgi:hypothetical protein